MKRVTTQSQPCVKDCLRRLSVDQKVVEQGNGQQEKHKCLPKSTKQKAGDIVTNGFKEVTEVAEAMDQTEVENRFR